MAINLDEHVFLLCASPQMKCEWEGCEQNVADLKEHIKSHAKTQDDYTCRWRSCVKNGEVFDKSSYVSHVKSHANERSLTCQKCQKVFSKLDALNKHSKKHETDDVDVERIVDKLVYLAEQRDLECLKTLELLEERQFLINCERLLHECLEEKEPFDDWNSYIFTE